MRVFTGTTCGQRGVGGLSLERSVIKTRDVSSKKLGFSPESNGELLEGFKHGNNKVSFTFGKDQSGSYAN